MSRSIKSTSLICVLVLFLLIPVNAAGSIDAYKLKDHIYSSSVSGNNRNVIYRFDYPSYATVYYAGKVYFQGLDLGSYSYTEMNGDGLYWHVWPLGKKYNLGDTASSGVIDVRDFHSYSTLNLSLNCSVDFTYSWVSMALGTAPLNLKSVLYFYFWGEDGSFLKSSSVVQNKTITLQELMPDEQYFSGTTMLSSDIGFSLPEGAAYFAPILNISIQFPDQSYGPVVRSIRVAQDEFELYADYNILVEDSETLKAVDDKLGKLNDKVDDLLEQPEQEKQEASSSGGDAADQLTGAIPDKSGGFMSAMSQLTNAMRYSGTEAKLTVPAITLPEIPGVMKSYQLSTEQEIDFGYWVNKMPSSLLELVRALLTIGLIVYSFKELYSTIAYALTLKGGGGSDG